MVGVANCLIVLESFGLGNRVEKHLWFWYVYVVYHSNCIFSYFKIL